MKTQGKINKLQLDEQYGLCYTTTNNNIIVKKDFKTIYKKEFPSNILRISYIQNKILAYKNDKSVFFSDIEKNEEFYLYEDDHIIFLGFINPQKFIYVTLNGIISIISIISTDRRTKTLCVKELVHDYFHNKYINIQTPFLSAYVHENRLFLSNIENKVIILSLESLEIEFIIDRDNTSRINVIRSLYVKKENEVFRIYSGYQDGEIKNMNILYREYAGDSSKYCFYGIFGWNHLVKIHEKPVIKIDSYNDKLITLCEEGAINIQEINKDNKIGKSKLFRNNEIEDFDIKDNLLIVSGSVDVINCLTLHSK